jgi:tetratricopeptide (TPR) repeat protein
LDELFVQLRAATNPIVAKQVGREIWAIWQQAPNDTAVQIMRNARSALDNRDFNSAIRFLDQLVTFAPEFAEAWNQRAIVLYFAEDYSGSLRDIEQTLALEPRHFGAMAGRGQVYLQLNELEFALQAFESALDLNPWVGDIRGHVHAIRARMSARQKPI